MSLIRTLNSEGQISLPLEVLRHLGLDVGDEVEFAFEGDETVLRPLRAERNPADRDRARQLPE